MMALSATVTTVSSRDFARDLALAKRATVTGPVFVTDRGRPTYALLRIDDYYKLAGQQPQSLLAVMDAIPGGDFVFEVPKLMGNGLQPVEF